MTETTPTVQAFDATVVSTSQVTPSFVRITLRTDHRPLGLAGADQRVALILPAPDGTARVAEGGDLYEAWRAMPDASRPLLRTYTVRRARPALREVDIDVVLHRDDGHAGPASGWAANVERGATVQLVGPDRDGRGRAWGVEWDPPEGADRLVLIGDETALPAIAAILEQASEEGPALLALVEVPQEGDRLELIRPGRAEVRWTVRGEAIVGEALQALVRAALPTGADSAQRPAGRANPPSDEQAGPDDDQLLWDIAEPGTDTGSTYVWLAGEAGALKPIRRYLRRDLGLPRSATSIMGYWKNGRAST